MYLYKIIIWINVFFNQISEVFVQGLHAFRSIGVRADLKGG